MIFKKYINSLNKKQLFQIYVIVFLLILFPYYKFITYEKKEDNKENKNLLKLNEDINKIKKQLSKPKFTKVLKDLELEAKKYDSFNIENFNLHTNSLSLSGISKADDFFRFLIYCENYSYDSRLKNLSIKIKDDLFSFSFVLYFSNKYQEKISKKEKKELENKIVSLRKKKTKEKLILQAILNKQVIINNKILKLGDKFNKYLIKEIHKTYILLEKNKIKKKLYIKGFKDE